MAKEKLKAEIKEMQNGNCALSGQPLSEETPLFDTNRRRPKAKGGTYLIENTEAVDPIAHMKHHDNFRQRERDFEELKTMMDDRSQMMKLKNKINNQTLAYRRKTDNSDPETVLFLGRILDEAKTELNKKTKRIEKQIEKMEVDSPIIQSAMGVEGIGPITVAGCLTYIDLEKARHASSLWAYVGLDKPSHSRYEKGVSGGGNKTLRTILYTMADSQMKSRGPYRIVYDRVKDRLSISEKMVMTRNTKGALIEAMWKDAKPSHRHGAALRAVMKHFLADYWYVGRTIMGLPTSPLYPEAVLGSTHRTIMPNERGWIY